MQHIANLTSIDTWHVDNNSTSFATVGLGILDFPKSTYTSTVQIKTKPKPSTHLQRHSKYALCILYLQCCVYEILHFDCSCYLDGLHFLPNTNTKNVHKRFLFHGTQTMHSHTCIHISKSSSESWNNLRNIY